MTVEQVVGDKKRYLPLLLLADEQENMIDRYLDRGAMFVLDDGGVKGECVVTDEGNGILELKSLPMGTWPFCPTVSEKGTEKRWSTMSRHDIRGNIQFYRSGRGTALSRSHFTRPAASSAPTELRTFSRRTTTTRFMRVEYSSKI